jgi:hypothetical protein
MHRGATGSVNSLSHPNSGLPEFGTLRWPKSDISDFGWEREQTEPAWSAVASRDKIPAAIFVDMDAHDLVE